MEDTAEQKLRGSIETMKEAISQEGAPRLKEFWEVRQACILLFKEGIHPALRAELWTEFSALSKQARQLNDLLGNEASFAGKQIEEALVALEKRVDALEPDEEFSVLNECAELLDSLREELTATKLRLSSKNRIFEKLSALGDRIFPRRRALIDQHSVRYTKEVDRFIGTHFSGDRPVGSPHKLREEIKVLQAKAKEFTLNRSAFAKLGELSECWERLAKMNKLPGTLEELLQSRIEVKGRIEEIERVKAASGLEMKKALEYEEALTRARDRLLKINTAIEGLEHE